jgi:hypothetical protein
VGTFSFDSKSAYEPPPLSEEMVKRVFLWNGIQDVPAVSVLKQIISLVNDGKTDTEFLRWCHGPDAPLAVAALEKKWMRLLFQSIALATFAHQEHLDVVSCVNVFPFWQLCCATRYCISHASLDGFVARFDDAVWEWLQPPNGWLCGCSIVPLLEKEGEAGQRRYLIVAPEMLRACTRWIDERPDHILSQL